MHVEIFDDNGVETLVIKLPVDKKPSKTGKSILIASSGGNKQTTLVVDGQPVFVGLNAFIKK